MLEIQSSPLIKKKCMLAIITIKLICLKIKKPIHFSRIDSSKNFRKQFIKVEIRDCANAIMLLSKFNDYALADIVVNYTISNFYSSTNHYFYFYRNKFWKSKIKYSRWQSWMLYALSFLKTKTNEFIILNMETSKKRIVYFVAHPSQYFIYKNVANKLDNDFEIVLVYTSKDILNTLVQNDNLSCQFHEITLYQKKGFLYSIMNLLKKEFQLFKIVRRYKPKLLIGTSVVICHIGFILRKPSVIVNEDDIDVISLSAKLGYPFATRIVSPIICNLGYFEKKAIKYNGYQKLAYLHPNYFCTRY
jgi:hypothetical protein